MERKQRKQRKQRTFTRAMIVEVPMIGPSHDGGPVLCIRCGRSFLNGDHWRRVSAADGSYSVGVHDACHSLAQAEQVQAGEP